MIKDKLSILIAREKVPVYKETVLEDGVYKPIKKICRYMICDNCGAKIKTKDIFSGRKIKLSYVITKGKTIEIALCSKCIKPVIEELWKI